MRQKVTCNTQKVSNNVCVCGGADSHISHAFACTVNEYVIVSFLYCSCESFGNTAYDLARINKPWGGGVAGSGRSDNAHWFPKGDFYDTAPQIRRLNLARQSIRISAVCQRDRAKTT